MGWVEGAWFEGWVEGSALRICIAWFEDSVSFVSSSGWVMTAEAAKRYTCGGDFCRLFTLVFLWETGAMRCFFFGGGRDGETTMMDGWLMAYCNGALTSR